MRGMSNRREEPTEPTEPTESPPAPDPALPGPGPGSEEPSYEARVLRAFIADGRLKSIPARDRKKVVIYRHLLDRVLPDPDEVVQERDLNMRLALWHPDVATIRRGFVDLGLASRYGMAYRRSVPRPG